MGEGLRGIISEGRHLAEVVHFGDQQVFEGATTYTCLLFLEKGGTAKARLTKVTDLEQWRVSRNAAETGIVRPKSLGASEWHLAVGPGAELFERLKRGTAKLGDLADIFVGLQTSADDVFILDFCSRTATTLRLHSKSLGCDWAFEPDLLRPLISGTDVSPYDPLPSRQYVLFPYDVRGERASLIPFGAIADCHPQTAEYLRRNRARLEGRERGLFRDTHWHRFGRSQNLGIQGRRKLCVPRLVDFLKSTIDEDGSYFLDNVDVGGVTPKGEARELSLYLLLGLLNSRLWRWYFPHVSAPFRGGFRSANKQFLSLLPTPTLGPSSEASRATLVGLVAHMLELHRRLNGAKTAHDRILVQRLIDSTDREIDRLVYELYELTPKEITIVESPPS